MFFDKKQCFSAVSTAWGAIKIIVTMALLVSCTPAFNWREVGFDQAGVTALLPCKPDRGTRAVQLGGQSVQMNMAGCESGGAMFAVSLVEAPAAAAPSAVQAIAQDLKASNKATHSRQIAHGRFVAQAAIYGEPSQGSDGPGALSSQAVETFLSNLKMAGAK
jgi:hypothetical protein